MAFRQGVGECRGNQVGGLEGRWRASEASLAACRRLQQPGLGPAANQRTLRQVVVLAVTLTLDERRMTCFATSKKVE